MNLKIPILLLLTVGCSSLAAEPPKSSPVYVYLFAHYEDHINLDLSEWRIKEVMRILSDAHQANRDRVVAAGEFYGTDSEIFQSPEEMDAA